jgi:hypothetical protein
VGLFTGLLLLPLAPVRGVAWIAEQLLAQAEREADPRESLRLRLEALQVRYELGEMTLDEYDEAEGALVEQLELLEAPAPVTPQGR